MKSKSQEHLTGKSFSFASTLLHNSTDLLATSTFTSIVEEIYYKIMYLFLYDAFYFTGSSFTYFVLRLVQSLVVQNIKEQSTTDA